MNKMLFQFYYKYVFSVFTGILVCVNYISIITFFPAVILLHHLYWEKYKCCCCCPRNQATVDNMQTSSNTEHTSTKRKNPIVRFFRGPYFWFITHKIIRWFILVFYVVILAVMLFWCTQLKVNEEQVSTFWNILLACTCKGYFNYFYYFT